MSWSIEQHIGELRPYPDSVRVVRGRAEESRRYVPEPPHCTMEPGGYWEDEYSYVTCSNCGEIWAFDCDGLKQHRWMCCPHCRAIIDYGEEE